MEVELVASDSLGVRSMATMVRTPDISVLIDPGVALGPLRFRLPPAPEEEAALEDAQERISELVSEADILVISHYHYDHYLPSGEGFAKKKLFLKDIRSNINKSQTERGKQFIANIEDKAEVNFSDNTSVHEGETTISFSPPVPHGPENTRLGYVIMTSISHGDETIVHTSDVEGLLTKEELQWILDQNPNLVIADGPPTYLLGFKFSNKHMETSVKNFKTLLDSTGCKLVIDHHLLRSKNYADSMRGLFDDPRVSTFARYNGTEETILEARRRELHAAINGGK